MLLSVLHRYAACSLLSLRMFIELKFTAYAEHRTFHHTEILEIFLLSLDLSFLKVFL